MTATATYAGLPFAAEYGGEGRDLTATMAALEQLGYECRDGGLCFSICTQIVSVGVPLARFGSEELRARHLPRVCDGSAVCAHAITEPEGGSDALNMATTATRRDGGFLLDGVKAHITNAPVADLFAVYARTDPAGGPFGITAFLVERGAEGLRTGEPVAKLGLDSSPVGTLELDGCFVPDDQVLGRVGGGFLVLDHVMKWEVLCSFAVTVGAMRHRLERCVERARSRRQFGQPIGSFQAISHRIVDMKIAHDTARRWLYDTAERVMERRDVGMDLAIAKLVASEANVASALAAIQIFGAEGYMAECGLEADLRDAVGGTIYSGTSEIQRSRIARMLGLPA